MKPLKIISLFDGMSCGQIALNRLGFNVKEYRASEIDKYAIKVTQENYPNTIQLGDVRNVHITESFDLILAGSPCQGFSRAGKGLAFEDPRSKLFFEFVRILGEAKAINPNVKFLLENVSMVREDELIISKILGVNAIYINSALVSAQNRERLYWTNIGMEAGGLFGYLHSVIVQPEDQGITLDEILEPGVDEKYFLSKKATEGLLRASKRDHKPTFLDSKGKSKSLDTRVGANTHYGQYIVHSAVVVDHGKVREIGNKSMNLDASYYKGHDNHGASTMIVVHNSQPRSGDPKKGGTGHLTRTDGKAYALDTKQSNRVQRIYDIGKGGQGNRVYSPDHKSVTLSAVGGGRGAKTGLYEIDDRIRRLTPLECERLQTVPDNYTNFVSDSQRYKMLGNGWTIDIITHILSYY